MDATNTTKENKMKKGTIVKKSDCFKIFNSKNQIVGEVKWLGDYTVNSLKVVAKRFFGTGTIRKNEVGGFNVY